MTDTVQADDGLAQARAEYARELAAADENEDLTPSFGLSQSAFKLIAALEAHAAALTRERDAAREALKSFANTWNDYDESAPNDFNFADWLRDLAADKDTYTAYERAAEVYAVSSPPSDSGDANAG